MAFASTPYLAQLSAVESELALLDSKDPAGAELRDKHRFLKGLLYWDLERDYKARLWRNQKLLRTLDRQIRAVQSRHHRVHEARDEWPQRSAELNARIAALSPRVAAVAAALDRAIERQRGMIESVAVDELTAQKARLDTYLVQARFSLAAIYDRAAERLDPEVADAGGTTR